MMKHVIFHGIPSMNKPTEEQVEQLRNADSQLGLQSSAPTPVQREEAPVRQEPVMDAEERHHYEAELAYAQALSEHRTRYRAWSNCVVSNNLRESVECIEPGRQPNFSDFYNPTQFFE